MRKLAQKLLSVQRGILETAVKKTAVNDHFKNSYAELNDVIDLVIPALNELNVVVLQYPIEPPFENNLALRTHLYDTESGEEFQSTLVIPLEKQNAQGIGSAITYARRYALVSLLGLKQQDDDGNAASSNEKQIQRPAVSGASKPFFASKSSKPTAKTETAKPPVRGKGKLFPSVGQEAEENA